MPRLPQLAGPRSIALRATVGVAIVAAGAMTLAGCSTGATGEAPPETAKAAAPTATATASAQADGCSTAGSAPDAAGAWTDDFRGARGTAPTAAIWTPQTGAGGWGNAELQDYRAANAILDGKGHLAITEKAVETATGTTYTSARLTTSGKKTFTYGTLSASIKLPDGRGLDPSFWLLGSNIATAGWPATGEIDVVATPDSTSTSVHQIHGPSKTAAGKEVRAVEGVKHFVPLSRAFHTFSVTRTPSCIATSIDGEVVQRVTMTSAPADMRWVFTAPEDVLLSLAVGGSYAKTPDASTPASATMLVDSVKLVPATY